MHVYTYIQYIYTFKFVADTFILQNCNITSLSIGTIRASCDSSSHQILITLRCTNNCTNPMLVTYGNSPLTVRGLDPGIMYSVTVNVFDGDQVVLRHLTVMQNITVMGDKSGKNSVHVRMIMYEFRHILYIHYV